MKAVGDGPVGDDFLDGIANAFKRAIGALGPVMIIDCGDAILSALAFLQGSMEFVVCPLDGCGMFISPHVWGISFAFVFSRWLLSLLSGTSSI
tara:strand:- start:570 stop:848 length:279 start_codon:yes stop_codon:yes gene_type:complete